MQKKKNQERCQLGQQTSAHVKFSKILSLNNLQFVAAIESLIDTSKNHETNQAGKKEI